MPNAAQALTNELDWEAVSTRRLLERVPADKLDWQPHPKAMTLGQLAFHLANIPGNISRLASLDGFDASTANFNPVDAPNAEALLPALETSLADARAFLGGLDDEASAAPWRLTAGERELFTIPRREVVRNLMLNHWYHHRGQLSVYLRFLDVPVPAIYGRSADENPFAEAA
jgi:uncharacterized damage-inducible protein DinB